MTHDVLLGVAVAAGVLLVATAFFWLDRYGRKAMLRTGAVAVTATLVTLALVQGGGAVFAGAGVWAAASMVVAGIWLVGLGVALGLAGLVAWTDLPLDGVVLGAVAGAAAGLGCAPALGEPSEGVMVPLLVGWLGAMGAWVGGGLSLAGLRSPLGRRVGAGAAAVVGGWLGGSSLLAGSVAAAELFFGQPALVAGGGLGAAVAAAGAVLWGQRKEAGILMQELTEEAGYGTLPVAVVTAVTQLGSRWRGDWWPQTDERLWLTATLSELAVRKHRLRSRVGGPSGLDGLHVGRIRGRVRACFDREGRDAAEDG